MMTAKEKVNILMVDDQPAKVMSYEAILAELDENLLKAHSAREALELLLKNEIAVVLMDVSMPEMDGFETAEIIHQHPRYQKTAIIFISAVHLTDVDQLRGYQRGAVDYISVPIIPELLRAKVSTFIDLHRKSQQLEALNVELRRLSMSLISTQDEERRRIARELHDGLGQDLTAAKMMLHEVLSPEESNHSAEGGSRESIREVSGMIDRMLQQVRNLSYLLHPPLLDEVGLRSALGWFLEGLTKRGGIETFLDAQPTTFPRLAAEVETGVFRIIQEALTNVFRHAQATKVWVSLKEQKKDIRVTVHDNGVGVANLSSQVRNGVTGVGIASMRQRAKELGGEISIRNANPGTIVELVVPNVQAQNAASAPRLQATAQWSSS
jgi:signal transduction histidine kinase